MIQKSFNRITIIVILLSYLFAPIVSAQNSEQPIPFDRLEERYCAGNKQKMTRVIRNNRELKSLMQKSNHPQVDFRTKMVIAVFQGRKPSSGYEIRVTKIVETPEVLKVAIEETSPGTSCNVLDAETRPCDLIVTKKVNKRVVFEISQRATDC